MNDKVLKNYTTIPPHLYVERSADKQLKYIIEDMQRPGYVLVARQMGKTNLLFNARRNLESNSRKFVYIDLSNNFSTERECYEFIIGSILDVLDDELWEIRDEIDKISIRTITDHVFYTKSLLKILRHLNRDLVIILDEIDALRTSEYSDNIFAVIRSNYFARSNFPELEKLTYILSGVIEPKDLIKDRNKSPFNIGEKIYLDDFSREEFGDFISKSKLELSSHLIEHIFSWTNGNPRLTFDICSDVETILNEKESIKKEDIDNLIKKKYLTSFDIAPIDHIRELVTDEKEIQKAVIQLHSNNEKNEISDKIKSKLYLYGIISSSDEHGEVRIKNKIIEESLTLSWLKSLSEDRKSIIDKAVSLIEKSRDYHQAIELLNSVIEKDKTEDKGNLSIPLFYLGYAEHSIGQFEKSNLHLLEKPVSKNVSPILHFKAKFMVGLNFYNLNNTELGNQALQDVLDNYPNTITWANAAINLAIHNDNDEKYLDILKSIIDDDKNIHAETESESESEVQHHIKIIKSYAYNQLATKSKDSSEKLDYIEKAIKVNIIEHVPYFMLLRGVTLGIDKSKTSLEIIDFVLDNQINFNTLKTPKSNIDYNYALHAQIVAYCFEMSKNKFREVLDYSVNDLNLKEGDFIYDVGNYIDEDFLRAELYHFYFKNIPTFAESKLYRAYIYSALEYSKRYETYFSDYMKSMLHNETLESADIAPLSLLYKSRIETENSELIKLDDYFDELTSLSLNFRGSDIYDSAVLCYWISEYYHHVGKFGHSQIFGKEVLQRLDTKDKERNIITEEGEKSIRTRVRALLDFRKSTNKTKPIRKTYDFGRNEKVTVRYNDGSEKTDKFKKLRQDIESGQCTILN